jgi:hypothetical protein
MTRIGNFIAEGAPFTIIGICLIAAGLVMYVCWRASAPDDYKGVRERPVRLEPWMREPSGERAQVVPRRSTQAPARHRADTMGGETTKIGPATVRAVIPVDERIAVPVPRPLERVQEPEPVTLVGWFYNMPMDCFVLLDSRDEIVCTIKAETWEDERGATAKALLVQGLPMIPDDVPYHTTRRSDV